MTDDRDDPLPSNVLPFRTPGQPVKNFADAMKPENLARMSPVSRAFFQNSPDVARAAFFPEGTDSPELEPPKGETDEPNDQEPR